MLNHTRRTRAGFSLIELMVVIALIGILMSIAIPTFGKWTADASVRAVAESLTNAIRQTQATAISRGRVGMFALTTDTPPVLTSTPVASASNWFSELNKLSGSDETQAWLGLILKSTEGTQRNVNISLSTGTLTCFNSLGRQSGLTAAQNALSTACSVAADDNNPSKYIVSRSGATRSFWVLVYPGGRVRMCDAAKTLSAANPDGCPTLP